MLFYNSILQSLIEIACAKPNFIILEVASKKLTASELLQKSKNVATALSNQNFKEGDIALMAVKPGIEFLILFYALLMLRGKIAVIDPEMGRDNYYSRMAQLSPSWLFADARLLFISRNRILRSALKFFIKKMPRLYLSEDIKILSVGINPFINKIEDYSSLLANVDSLDFNYKNDVYECLIIYTSGTLGTPKGVVHTIHSLQETLNNLKLLLKKENGEILGTHLPHFMLLGVSAGYSVRLINPKVSPRRRLKELKYKRINACFGTPAEFLSLVKYCENKRLAFPQTLHQIFVGSAPVYKSFLKRLICKINTQAKVTCFYGMTEHLITSTISGSDKLLYIGEGDVVGKVFPGVNITIASDDEIQVQSPQLFARYLHETKGRPWHSTGDLGIIDNDGNLILKGRKKDMIIRKDFNIYPALYEETLRKIGGVTDAVLVGIFDENLQDEKVILVWEGAGITDKELYRKILSGQNGIDAMALPDKIIKMKIPRSGRHQKTDKKLLRLQLKKTFF